MQSSLRREVWAHKTSLTPPLFIEVPVPSRESDQSCICVLGVWILPLYASFLLNSKTAQTVILFVFHFITHIFHMFIRRKYIRFRVAKFWLLGTLIWMLLSLEIVCTIRRVCIYIVVIIDSVITVSIFMLSSFSWFASFFVEVNLSRFA